MIELFKQIRMMQKYILIKVIDVYLFSGVALSNLGKINEAIIMYDRALEMNPYDKETYCNMGILFITKLFSSPSAREIRKNQ